MKRADQIKAMKMPMKNRAQEEAELDLEMLGEEEMPMEEKEEEMAEGEMPEEMGALEDISDEDLIAEMKKRGLIEAGEMEEEAEEEMPA